MHPVKKENQVNSKSFNNGTRLKKQLAPVSQGSKKPTGSDVKLHLSLLVFKLKSKN